MEQGADDKRVSPQGRDLVWALAHGLALSCLLSANTYAAPGGGTALDMEVRSLYPTPLVLNILQNCWAGNKDSRKNIRVLYGVTKVIT